MDEDGVNSAESISSPAIELLDHPSISNGDAHQVVKVVPLKLLPVLASLLVSSVVGSLLRVGLIRIAAASGPPVLYPQLVGCIIMGWTIKTKSLWVNKYYPLYLGITTGLCGSITSFSGLELAAFREIFNIDDDYDSGKGVLAGLGLLISVVCVSVIAISFGEHVAKVVDPQRFFGHGKIERTEFEYQEAGWIGNGLSKTDFWICGFAVGLFLLILTLIPFYGSSPWLWTSFFAPIGVYFISHKKSRTWLISSIGTFVRYYLSRLNLRFLYLNFPVGTYAVNVIGTLILGVVFVLERTTTTNLVSCAVFQGLSDGFCGCLTTVSTWVVELRTMQLRSAYIYGLASIVGGILVLVLVIGGVKWSLGFSSLCSI